MTENRENTMGSKAVFPLILTMSGPAALSMFVQALYNIVDSIFVSKLGETALRAVSIAFPAQMLIVSAAVGTGIGVKSLVARKLGERDRESANSAADHGVVLALLTYALFVVLGLFLTRPFFSLFSTDASVISMGCTYFYIVCFASVGAFLECGLSNTLQATGNMVVPMWAQLSGAITNIVLDPILIFGLLGFPKMGIAGAAAATVIGQFVAMAVSARRLFFGKNEVELDLKKFRFSRDVIGQIYAVALPSAAMQAISSFLVMFLNGILASLSEVAVTVLGVYFKLQSFVFMPVFGLNQGIISILGYNYGARKKDRIEKTLKIAVLIAVAVMLIGTLLFFFIPGRLMQLFETTPEMLAIGVPALKTICLCFVPAAISIVVSSLFQSIGLGVRSLLTTLIRQIIVLLPAAYFFSKISLNMVWWAFPLAEVAALIMTILLFIDAYKKRISVLEN